MKQYILLNEIFYDFDRDEDNCFLILPTETASLRVGCVGVKAAIAVDMAASHHCWKDD